jgi:hypothetical protein
MATVEYNNDTSGKCTVTPSDISNIYVGLTITITANSGYKFHDLYGTNWSSPRLAISMSNGFSTTTNTNDYFDITLSSDKKTISIYCKNSFAGTVSSILCNINPSYPIETDTPISYPTLTLTKNLSNVTMSPDVSSIEIDGTSHIITLTANSGYEFSGVPKLTISGTDYNFSLSNGVYTLDVNNIGITSDVSGTITATATQIVVNPIVTITKNLTNVTMSPDVSSIELDGTSKVIALTANNGYEFSGVPYFIWDRDTYRFTQSGNSYIYDLNDVIDENASITIHATATAIAQTKDVTNSLTNCSVTPSFSSMVEGTSYNLTLNANQGFKFVTTPTLSMNNRDNVILDFTKVTDYQYTLSFTAESSYFNTNINAVLSGVAVEETPIVNKYGAIQVYKPSTSDMASLATKRFRENGTVDGITYNDVDLGSYITQFKRVFFNVVTSAKQNILLGVHDTLINTDTVFNDDVTIDCGTVFIEGANGNELDTKIYKIKIVLPFYEVVELPSIYMNKTIHIVYQANVITGYADILINEVVSNTDLLIVKYRCKISQDLPYILDYDKLNGALSDMQLNTSPKIILQKNNTFIDKGYNTYKEDLISNEIGYFEVKDIVSMSVNATQKEKDLIENLLKSGVYL